MRHGTVFFVLPLALSVGGAFAQAPGAPSLPPRPSMPSSAPVTSPAPVAPPAAQASAPPSIPVRPSGNSPALPPPQTAGGPGAAGTPSPSPAAPGAPGAKPGAPLPKTEPLPSVVSGPEPVKGPETELTRVDYQKRLTDCLEYRGSCHIRSLTRADQDFFRYEVRNRRFPSEQIGDIVESRMYQFGNAMTVNAPKETGNPEWRTSRFTLETVNRGSESGSAMAVAGARRPSQRFTPGSRGAAYDANQDW